MITALALALVAVASTAVGVWDLARSRAGDVLRATALAEVALLIGAGVQPFFGAGLAVGGAAAFALAFGRLDGIVQDRLERVEADLVASPDEATSLLLLHDRIDALHRPGRSRPGAKGLLAMLFVLLAGVGVIGVGLASALWPALVLGSLLLYTPVALGLRWLADSQEAGALRRRLPDAPPGGLDLLDAPGA